MLEIIFDSEDFPQPGPVQNGPSTLRIEWDDLLWAAVTVGRPNRHYVFQNGMSSIYEAIFRISAVRLAVEQITPYARRLRRTPAARQLDPSEKGALNYFLGLTLCKLFADKCLNAPWMLHLDVFRDQLNPGLLNGRSRPDLVGQTADGQWVAMESKGRASSPSTDCKDKAKEQAERIVTVQGQPVQYRIGAVAYFRSDVLRFFWRDPAPDGKVPENAIELDITANDIWQEYYQPILGLSRGRLFDDAGLIHDIADVDLKIEIVPDVMKLLHREKWKDAGEWCVEHRMQIQDNKFHIDGIRVSAGDSWKKRFQLRVE